ncbi:MAG: 4-(cytidine 5'-diphospho)-2-C-methyl-D-erythritol kinase [Candidatus Adiutrix sp.]|jgi:4-diphosphocytidyl-2-C-methyl-D-erythritol kinase|nr:4-(cytidine 5'-diphospho)-2-C-methyl-D-erythritol kinase [Candidatus Adiutrix sp.]
MTAIGRRPAPAKINLGLRVLGRRPDGYHELDTVMAKLNLADFIRLEPGPGPGPDGLFVTTSLSGLPPDFASPDNLALKAAAAFRLATGWPKGAVSIFLEKHIPLGAGLGGGSADGAAVLKALNQASPAPLASEALARLALSLGADVPFALSDYHLARAGGVGERLSPAPETFQAWAGRRLVLLNPGFPLSTALVFKNLGLTNGPSNNNLRGLEPAAELRPGANDLLPVARRLAPVVDELVTVVSGLAPAGWGLSGSGPTFWLDTPMAAEALTRAHPGWWAREVRVATFNDS